MQSYIVARQRGGHERVGHKAHKEIATKGTKATKIRKNLYAFVILVFFVVISLCLSGDIGVIAGARGLSIKSCGDISN
ncbi:MAG: hypothetical protein AB7P99_19065 [Vicinamibacterales bacterium]